MPINQIFNKIIPEILLNNILSTINIKNLNDISSFTYSKINNNLDKLKIIMEDIKLYYIPCKRNIYFKDNLTPKKFITIFRQILKLYYYTLSSKEKYIPETKKKYIEFYLKPVTNNKPPRIITNNIVLSFN
jgi:hypothetical protein